MAGFEGILYISLLIIFAKLFEEIAVRLKQPPIVGYIVAGIVLGPAVLSWVHPADDITLFIQIGIFFLFFLIGLEEIDIRSIFSVLRKRLFLGAIVGFVVPFGLAIPVLFYFTNLAPIPMLAVASVLGISSLGVVAKILMDYGKLREPLGLEIFTLTAVLEFIGLLVASVFIQLAHPTTFLQSIEAILTPFGFPSNSTLLGSNATTTSIPVLGGTDSKLTFDTLAFAWMAVRMLIFFSAVTIFGLKVLPRIMIFVRARLRVKQIYFGLFVGMILLISYFAEASGIYGAFGALLLGVLFAQIPKKDYEQEVSGLRAMANGIFIPIFFAGIGIYFSFGFLSLPYYLIAAVIIVVTVGKFGSSVLAAAVANLKPVIAVGAGVMAKGTIDLALMLSLLSVGLVQPNLFSLVVFGIVVMMLATSATLKRGFAQKSASTGEGKSDFPMEVTSETLTPLYARALLGELRVRNVLASRPPTVYGETSVRELADKHRDYYNPAYLAVTRDGSYLGIVTPEQFHKIKRENWDATIVNDISLQNIRAVKMDDYLYDVVEYMSLHDLDLLAVVTDDDTRVLGGVMRKDILDYVPKI